MGLNIECRYGWRDFNVNQKLSDHYFLAYLTGLMFDDFFTPGNKIIFNGELLWDRRELAEYLIDVQKNKERQYESLLQKSTGSSDINKNVELRPVPLSIEKSHFYKWFKKLTFLEEEPRVAYAIWEKKN